ncbi:MAG: hypothetical protein BWK80_47185 [Desulfobacteraceae bacterium IS3]|nr:MAG: hypothetical protein BWK80_47185 [Desulfobacteraceae bacterium IS3]
MNWTLEKAGQHFSELIREAAHEPQTVFDCNRLVAAVIDAETFKEFENWRIQREKCSPADKFAELRRLCLDESYSLELPDRCDRNNVFSESRNELSL